MSGLWYVKLPDGDVEPLTLDELDEAFQRGAVNEQTMVLAAGSTQWAKLGELAGLDQQQPPARRPSLVAIPAMANYPMPMSTRPVSVDLEGFGDDDMSFRPPKKSKKWMVGVALVAGVLGVAAFEAQRSGVVSISRLMSSSSQAAAVATMPVTAAPAPAPVPEPAPAATTPAATPNDTSTARFTQDQKDKLAAADKAKTKLLLHSKAHAATVSVHSSAPHSKGAQGFTTGGNKYDPLNATIP